MTRLEKIIDYIKSESGAECSDLTIKAGEECERISAEYARIEQEEYWSAIDQGTKETELRLERLNSLAEAEASKQIATTKQELIAEAFALAAIELGKLPRQDFTTLLAKLGLDSYSTAEDVVARYRKELEGRVTKVLFD